MREVTPHATTSQFSKPRFNALSFVEKPHREYAYVFRLDDHTKSQFPFFRGSCVRDRSDTPQGEESNPRSIAESPALETRPKQINIPIFKINLVHFSLRLNSYIWQLLFCTINKDKCLTTTQRIQTIFHRLVYFFSS